MTRPAISCAIGLAGSRSPDGNVRNVSAINNSPSMPSRTAMRRMSRWSVKWLTSHTPTKALPMPPASSPIIAGRYGMTAASDTAALRTANAKLSVTRLISRFSGTAERASKPMPCINTGKRNSPPPSPISPPSPPIGTHQPKARRKYGQAMARIMAVSLLDRPYSRDLPASRRLPRYRLGFGLGLCRDSLAALAERCRLCAERAAHRLGLAVDDLQQGARRPVRHPPLLLPIAQRRQVQREGFREAILRHAEFGADRLDVGRHQNPDLRIIERPIGYVGCGVRISRDLRRDLFIGQRVQSGPIGFMYLRRRLRRLWLVDRHYVPFCRHGAARSAGSRRPLARIRIRTRGRRSLRSR